MTFIERAKAELSKGALPAVIEAAKPCPPASRADTVRRVACEIFDEPVSVFVHDEGDAYHILVTERDERTRTKKKALEKSGFSSLSAYLRHSLLCLEVHETRNVFLHGFSPENVRVMLRQAIPGHKYRTQVLDEGTMSVTRAA